MQKPQLQLVLFQASVLFSKRKGKMIKAQLDSGFSLQKLLLGGLPKLVEFPEWLLQASTNALQCLKIGSCQKLKELPACLQSIASLQQLVIQDCYELSRRCEHGKGEYWSKIAHIPQIVLYCSDINSTHYKQLGPWEFVRYCLIQLLLCLYIE
ncbi:putative disease resistance protein RGA4 [Hevea brasiliensis]|uniref:putative disease resistance protein RGA4 n=1 Tax=Hevea brasiliensis TaxID=3981 RepID=UPI0025D0B5CC|nr:putative disease resistance protein RGA4 [Hevea brasiliensis]